MFDEMSDVIIKCIQRAEQALVRDRDSVQTRMSESQDWLAYVGCRTTRERNAHGQGLTAWRAGAGGQWKQMQLMEGLRNPSYLCLHPSQRRLYAVHGDFSEISTFAVGPDGLLEKLAQQDTCGFNPVHLALTPSQRWLLVANYASGNVVTMRVAEDGSLGAVAHVLELPGEHGPHAQQHGSHPHQVCFSPDGRYALIPDKGLDVVFALRVNEDTGRLDIATTSPAPRACGPRHMVFHPRLPLAYVVGELDRTVLPARYDAATGRLHFGSVLSSVPEGLTQGSAAGIVLSSDARRLFVSNRGHDSVAVYPVNATGELGTPSWIDAGRTPRFISQSPADDSVIVAREDGHSIAALHGAEPPLEVLAQTGSPVCIVFRKVNP
jgi:6-phosphogluconolactonase (cycloisomerase 2 family)